jgi:AcrR family transcriptional regulator
MTRMTPMDRDADSQGAVREETRRARPGQRQRTRKELLLAASRLLKQGRRPSLDEVAEAANVSRATAYRYFPGMDALLLEASLELVIPDAQDILAGVGDDPVARLEAIDDALTAMILANEHTMRAIFMHSLQRAAAEDDVALRQDRRTPMIEAALAPARESIAPADYDLLVDALALVIGVEPLLVFKDVLLVDEAEARRVKRFVIRAVVEAAQRRG